MAITHFTPQLIGRGDGRSAVLAAAYRHCAKMEFEAEGRTVDYSNKRGMAHEEFLVPADALGFPRFSLLQLLLEPGDFVPDLPRGLFHSGRPFLLICAKRQIGKPG